jgi:hypothetical protein
MRARVASAVSDETRLNRRRDSRDDDDGRASEVDGRNDTGTCGVDAAGGRVEGRWTSDEAARMDADPHCEAAPTRSTWWLRRGSPGARAGGWVPLSPRVQRSGLIGIVGGGAQGRFQPWQDGDIAGRAGDARDGVGGMCCVADRATKRAVGRLKESGGRFPEG